LREEVGPPPKNNPNLPKSTHQPRKPKKENTQKKKNTTHEKKTNRLRGVVGGVHRTPLSPPKKPLPPTKKPPPACLGWGCGVFLGLGVLGVSFLWVVGKKRKKVKNASTLSRSPKQGKDKQPRDSNKKTSQQTSNASTPPPHKGGVGVGVCGKKQKKRRKTHKRTKKQEKKNKISKKKTQKGAQGVVTNPGRNQKKKKEPTPTKKKKNPKTQTSPKDVLLEFLGFLGGGVEFFLETGILVILS